MDLRGPAQLVPGDGGAAVVAIGGGSGLSMLLRGLKPHLDTGLIRDLTGVVAVSDDGGSSGRLRRDLGMLAPGDIRNCLVALAEDEDLLTRLFQYRFENGDGLSGHSFGNLFLAALTGITGDFYQAILTAERVLSVRGRVLPATLTDIRLRAVGASGTAYEGESAVGGCGERLAHLELQPAAPEAFAPALAAIREADIVVVGPGSLYTSILPNLLVPQVRAALCETAATVVLVLNLMTQPGETDTMDALDHIEAIERHAGPGLVDFVLANRTAPGRDSLMTYSLAGSDPVSLGRLASRPGGPSLVPADLLARGALIRHDAARLSTTILALVGERPYAPRTYA